MKLSINSVKGDSNKLKCFVHARAGALSETEIVMTMQRLDTRGMDTFENIHTLKSHDGGKTFSEPFEDPAFTDRSPYFGDDVFSFAEDENGVYRSMCDASHLFHKKTGKLMVIGAYAAYKRAATEPIHTEKLVPLYTVYNPETGLFSAVRKVKMPDGLPYRRIISGCVQFIENDNGEILLPVYLEYENDKRTRCAVLKLSFDGENAVCTEIGNELFFDDPRGICEPSICFFKGKYYLTLRSDSYGLYSVSDDGMNFEEPKLWRWDTDEILPNYNTQQHFLVCGGKLYLVYTRKAGNNDHVFRHRAPLFIAEVDTNTMRILRHTEKIAVPERGARLGNFGVTYIDENKSLITAAEWMQNDPYGREKCERFGSDNSIFIVTVEN